MFAVDSPDLALESAFAGARHVLHRLGQRSPQAMHYFEILGNLGDAVKLKRQARASQSGAVIHKIINLSSFSSSTTTMPAPVDMRSETYGDESDVLTDIAGGAVSVDDFSNMLFDMPEDHFGLDDALRTWSNAARGMWE